MAKTWIEMVLAIVVSGILIWCFSYKWYVRNARWVPVTGNVRKLTELADSAIANADVPVAALVVYNGNIIGEGYNTVRKNRNAGGHAEINAISDAMERVGYDSFMHLGREKLYLVTTWEPCAMCRGAIMNYAIKHVVVMHPKSFREHFKEWVAMAKYEWYKQGTTVDTLQVYLFRDHPGYNKLKSN